MSIANYLGLESVGSFIRSFLYAIASRSPLPEAVNWVISQIPMENLNQIYIVTEHQLNLVALGGITIGFIVGVVLGAWASNR